MRLLAGFVALLLVASVAQAAPEDLRRGAGEAFGAGRFEAAVAAWTDALEQAEAEQDRGRASAALLGRAEAYQALGFYPRAVADLERALEQVDASSDPGLAARLHGSLGNTLLLFGNPHRAAEELGQCLEYSRRAADRELEARTWNNVGNLLALHPQSPITQFPADPRAAYRQSQLIAIELGDGLLAANSLVNTARMQLAEGEEPEAVATLREALALYRELPSSGAKAMGLVAGAYLLGRVESTEDAALDADVHAALTIAERVAREVGDARSQSYANGYLGARLETLERNEEALRLTDLALFEAQQANAPEIAYLWQWQRGRLLRAAGDQRGARASLEGAVATLRTMRTELSAGYVVGESFRDSVGQVYLELVDLLLRDADAAVTREQAQADLRRARTTMELLKTAELEDYFRDECVAMLQAKTSAIDELMSGAAALYPILLPDRTELLLSLPSGIERATVPVGAEQVHARVLEFRRLLEKRTRQYLRPARDLYDWLVRPFEDELKSAGIETLVFIPSGLLRTIPLAPLHDGQAHLFERYATAVTPGLTLLGPRPLPRDRVQLLLAGLSEPVQGFDPLPHVEVELANVHELFGGEVFKDAEFRTSAIEQALKGKPYSIVHVASHAEISADARLSFLLTHDGRLTMDELESLVKLTRFREEPIELLTLSACATAAGDERAALGLAGVGIKAGARSALASLWFVNDQASAELVTLFYGHIKRSGVSKAEALRRAQMTLYEDPRYRYPVYWAPFLLIGNWL